MLNAPAKLRILCVDDEPQVLQGLALHLDRDYEFHAAHDAQEAIALVASSAPFAVILADMRMPGISGAELLTRVHQRAPETVGILLTGYGDVEAAVDAVNNGRIFRFLTKPCPSGVLRKAVADAAKQYELVHAERDLIERTLRGAVQALAEVLAISEPDAYGRAGRVQRLALQIAERTDLEPRWPLELASMLSQIGTVSLPPEVVKKLGYGETLTDEEKQMVAQLPEVTERLLAPIPRLESVRAILKRSQRRPDDETDAISRAAAILRLAEKFDLLESSGCAVAVAMARLRAANEFDVKLLDILEKVTSVSPDRFEVRELPLRLLQVGMVLAEDLRTKAGSLLAPRGAEVTASFVERAKNFQQGTAREPVRVMLRGAAPPPSPQVRKVA
jgi:response regulator RpfG family c-di-GMP phosphodiesterase